MQSEGVDSDCFATLLKLIQEPSRRASRGGAASPRVDGLEVEEVTQRENISWISCLLECRAVYGIDR